jgi:UDP-2-acetamido-3-amino-2,3-dideoxy-glucuronate N-acetyltransferase
MLKSAMHDNCQPTLVNLPVYADSRGDLMVAEFQRLPFIPKRLFIQSTRNVGIERGDHAHFSCNQLLIAVQGSVEVNLRFCGGNQTFLLENSSVGLFMPPLVWATQRILDQNGRVLVLASEDYSEHDYIRSKDQFENLLKLHIAI